MSRPMLLALFLAGFFAVACGGGQNAAPQPGNSSAATGNAPVTAANAAANSPSEAPGAFRKLATTSPTGWVSLSKDGRAELERHVKKLPGSFEYVAAVTSRKAPGATEPQDHWQEWGRHAAGASLYRVSTKVMEPETALAEFAGQVAAGVPEPKTESGVAWTSLQGGEVLLAALSNRHGTYLVVGIIQDTENQQAHARAIVKWAQSIKPEA